MMQILSQISNGGGQLHCVLTIPYSDHICNFYYSPDERRLSGKITGGGMAWCVAQFCDRKDNSDWYLLQSATAQPVKETISDLMGRVKEQRVSPSAQPSVMFQKYL